MGDLELMKEAIAEAKKYDPPDPSRVPQVGAIITVDEEIVARGHRGEHDHAEKNALDNVSDKGVLIRATIYTTLEPCTGAVRSRPQEACTNLLTTYPVKKVFIGILDPNQGVCGKGLLELQKSGIEVALFEHELAKEIRSMNDKFIRAQQALGAEIFDPEPGAVLETYCTEGYYTFKCICVNEPGDDIVVLVRKGGHWWPQPEKLKKVADKSEYHFRVQFGTGGEHEVVIVRVSELGAALTNYYRHVADRNFQRRIMLKALPDYNSIIEPTIKQIGDYPGIPMTNLPRGLDRQASIIVNVIGSNPITVGHS